MPHFSNPFGWDWMPRDQEIIDITSGTPWTFTPWTTVWDKFEELRKLAKTFEEIKNVTINLTFDEDKRDAQIATKKTRYGFRHNQLTSVGNTFYVNVNPTNEKFLTNDAKLEHNISHILYDSPIKESRHLAHRLSLGTGIPEKLKDDALALSPDCNLCEDICRHIFDILEDVRVDSLWGDLYLGTQQDYEDCQEKVKKKLKDPITNPIQALWYARNGKFDDSEMSKTAEKYLNDIRDTDYPAGPLLQKSYFQDVVLPWLKEQEFNNNDKKSKSKNNKKNKKDNKSNQKNSSCNGKQPSFEDVLKAIAKDIKSIRNKHNITPDHRGLDINLNHKKRKSITNALKENKGNEPVGDFSYEPGQSGGNGKSYDKYDPAKIQQLKDRGRERNTKIRNHLVTKGLIKDKTLEAYNFDPEQFDIITRYESHQPFNVDENTVKRLMRVWQQARGEVREVIDEEGEEIDIESYIQEIPSTFKDNVIFVSEKDEPGLHIVYSADCSGSMDGVPLQMLRDVTATIKKSLKHEPKIKMSMIGWGGGEKTGISVHSTMEDINRFTVADNYGGTPEANALWYSSTWLQRQPEYTKVLFFVSDGAFSEELAKEQVTIARGNGLHVFGIGISDHSMDEQYRTIFGSGNYTIVTEDAYNTGLNRLINDIANFISCHIRSVS
ncbi:hypothetical protein CL622_07585 [archaeon]|nr:hypothetical protein [archaeon]|tara:strand:+ start:3126 stop:5117 length:1992 start_codon:yes stop_codon:yes gene_type:complete